MEHKGTLWTCSATTHKNLTTTGLLATTPPTGISTNVHSDTGTVPECGTTPWQLKSLGMEALSWTNKAAVASTSHGLWAGVTSGGALPSYLYLTSTALTSHFLPQEKPALGPNPEAPVQIWGFS